MNAFPAQQLDDVDYLLEEDAATVGFKPFRDSKDCHIYTDHNGDLKKRSTDPGVERYHPNVEMAARIRGILQDGVTLATAESEGAKSYPIYMIGDKFRFLEEGPPDLSSKTLSGQQSPMPHNIPDSEYEHATPFLGSQHSQIGYQRPPSVEPSESQQSLSRDMHQMVEDLLTPSKIHPQQLTNNANETSYGIHSATALDLFNNMQLQPDHHQQMQSRISGFPGLTSAFAPRPGELGGMGASIPGAGLRLPALRPDGPAAAFNTPIVSAQTQSHPYQISPNGPWNQNRTPPPHMGSQHRPQYNVAQELQKSLAAEYQASGFSNTSSLYQNTPAYGHENNGSRDALPNLQMWNDTQPIRRASPGYHR